MIEKKDIWLSETLKADLFFKGTMNIVISPCGSGKTEAAISILASTASQPNKALYLIDTTSGCQRVENDKENRMKAPCHYYSEDIESNYFDSEFDKEKIVVTTYAKFGSWCSRYPDFADHFEIIACDEVHNLVQFSTFNNKDDDGVNYTAIAKNSICAAVKRGKTLFFGITATPEYLDSWTCPQYYVPIDTSQLKHYEEKETVYYASIHQLLKSISPSQRGALYVTRVTQMVECEKIAKKCGHSPICLWSPAYEKRRMNDEQMRVRNHLLQYEEVPPEYNLLIINASCETAINIRSHMDYFIVHNSNPTHITQARGRYRHNLQTLYLLDKDNGKVIIPEEYIGCMLFKEGKAALNKEVFIKNDKGRFIPWSKLSQLITDSGYTITEGKADNRPYVIIQRR